MREIIWIRTVLVGPILSNASRQYLASRGSLAIGLRTRYCSGPNECSKPTCTQVADGSHSLQLMRTVGNLRTRRFRTRLRARNPSDSLARGGSEWRISIRRV